VVPGGALHGERVAHPSQPPTGERERPRRPQANVAGVCQPGCGDRRHKGEPREANRLAPVGHAASVGGQSVHPQAQSQLVGAAPHGSVSTGNVLRLLEHQQYRCALTGRKLTPQTAAIDHIVPVRRGGEHVIENAQILHRDVNRAKGSMTSDEFTCMCREVVRWSDSPIT